VEGGVGVGLWSSIKEKPGRWRCTKISVAYFHSALTTVSTIQSDIVIICNILEPLKMWNDGDEAESTYLEIVDVTPKNATVKEDCDSGKRRRHFEEDNLFEGSCCGAVERTIPILQTRGGKWKEPICDKVGENCMCFLNVKNDGEEPALRKP
jgi:hypothetical protein